MLAPRSRIFAALGALVLGAMTLGGCSRHGEGEAGESQAGSERPSGALSGEGPSAPAPNNRVPAFSGEVIGPQPGYLQGAIVHAAIELGALHGFLRTLPLDARGERDLAELAQVVPNPRGADLLARLGLAADARLSLSLRPVTTWEAELSGTVDPNDPTWQAFRTWRTSEHHGWAEVEAVEGQAPVEIPAPARPSAAVLDLDRKIKSLGFHLRVDVPVADPSKLRPLLDRVAAELRDPRWTTTCAAVGSAIACGGQSDGVAVVRERKGGVVLDLLLTFVGDADQPDDAYRRAAILQALAVPSATPAAVAGLRGDFGLALDGPGIAALTTSAEFASSLRWGDSDLDRLQTRTEALAELRGPDSARIFDGLLVEGRLGSDHLDAAARWRVRPGVAKLDEMFELSEIDADVPTLAALCDGALICGRSRGLPKFERFASLATGLYADPKRLSRTLDRHDELGLTVLALETWPNAIASLSRLGPSLGQGPEAYMAQNALGIASRMLGFGFSVRSIDELDRGFRGDWLAYTRVSAADLAGLTGFMTLAEIPMTPTTISGVDASVSFAHVPEREIDANIYALSEPETSTGAWGWAVLADADDRVRWFAELAHDDGAAPLLYLELSDLWRVVAASRELERELGWARSWLAQRWIRGQVELGAGESPVVVRLAMGKRG